LLLAAAVGCGLLVLDYLVEPSLPPGARPLAHRRSELRSCSHQPSITQNSDTIRKFKLVTVQMIFWK
jgi:hypothetical protein